MIGDLVKLCAQYGLPTVLLFVVGWAYDRQQKKHDAERLAWQLARDAAGAKHEIERAAWAEERREMFESTKEDSERIQGILLKVQEHSTTVINKASDIAATLEQEKKDIREARDRELREGSRIPGRQR